MSFDPWQRSLFRYSSAQRTERENRPLLVGKKNKGMRRNITMVAVCSTKTGTTYTHLSFGSRHVQPTSVPSGIQPWDYRRGKIKKG